MEQYEFGSLEAFALTEAWRLVELYYFNEVYFDLLRFGAKRPRRWRLSEPRIKRDIFDDSRLMAAWLIDHTRRAGLLPDFTAVEVTPTCRKIIVARKPTKLPKDLRDFGMTTPYKFGEWGYMSRISYPEEPDEAQVVPSPLDQRQEDVTRPPT